MTPRRTLTLTALALLLAPGMVHAQDPERPTRWRRRAPQTAVPVTVFHSTQALNLPTAETIAQGEWLFEISHRFLPEIGDTDAFLGFDGPIRNRIGLAYGLSDRAQLTLQRSNLDDNVDLNLRVRAYERGGSAPLMLALVAGGAWNTEVPGRSDGDDRNFQYYFQGVANVGLGKRAAVGIVPTFVHNPYIREPDADDAFALGVNGALYLGEVVALVGEWNFTEARTDLRHDAGALGIQLETGGHFFKLEVTNALRMNPAQYPAGAASSFKPSNWHWGFNITRLLAF